MALRDAGRVLVVGAGPAGLALAYLLARRGVGVTVVESHHDFARAFRGEGLQRSGIDAFRQMGLGEQFDRMPFIELKTIDIYSGGRLSVRATAEGLGRGQVRVVSQPLLLRMLADEAGAHPNFRLDTGVTVRDLLRENGRVLGVRTTAPDGPREYRADLVIGADGRHSATRKHSDFPEFTDSQHFDIIWLRLPYPEAFPNRETALFEMASTRAALAFPTADGQLQVGFVIPKGGYAALRAGGPVAFADALIGRLPAFLADHLRAHRDAVAGAAVLNVVSGRLAEWSAPGLLLIGDAAHPMSPVGGQGVNIALRDALVAANHLCPVLAAGGGAAAVDAAAGRVRDERLPEVAAVRRCSRARPGCCSTPAAGRTG
jgi:2-polyprenyl-6-methoxyphenol hydroxylase-like FAD-dependent oxidoreductase